MVSYVVIGASRGIGLGFVQALSSDPENIVFASVRNKSTTTQLRDFVNSEANKHKNVVVLEADLNDYKSLKTAAKEVSKATQGELDVLINNGALFYHERGRLTMDSYPDEETLENDLLSFFKTNVVGTTHAINAFISSSPRWKNEEGPGCIVFHGLSKRH
ncbi:NAD-binding protein [Sanghuangporus baumii]|uniref:NAD-binding protein n=1 Tax=Sanghuangporus baumii TaxID=108892 RepID=A0A9Q5HQT8_SANBA|nr:NAD-binding protein [Sanghuangporus baumii]